MISKNIHDDIYILYEIKVVKADNKTKKNKTKNLTSHINIRMNLEEIVNFLPKKRTNE